MVFDVPLGVHQTRPLGVHFMMELEQFQRQSGFCVTYDKTQIYRIVSLKHSNASLYTQQQIRWTNESINVLCVDIHWDNDVVLRKNYDKIVEKVGATLKGWSSRSLSLAGKVTIVNTLIGSLFVYNMSVIPAMSTETITKVEKLIESFLWNGRRPKIPLKVLQSPKNLGGLNLISLKAKDDAMKLTWFHILQEDEELAYLVYKKLCAHSTRGHLEMCSKS